MRDSKKMAPAARRRGFGRRSATARRRAGRSARLKFEPLERRLVLDAASVIISEFLADNNNVLLDQDGDSSDWLELYNPSGVSVELDGWHLTDDDDPDALDKWTFPDVTLGAGQYLLVFASGKDRSVAGAELHTNFNLAAGGEYLALVDAAGTIVHQYAPEYPRQLEDVSYGMLYDVLGQTSLVGKGDDANYLVPADGTLGLSWIEDTFDDGGWDTGTTGLGFGLGVPDGSVTIVPPDSTWRYLDDGSDQGTAWRESGFDDGPWSTGAAQLGYGEGDENTVIGYGPDSGNKYITSYFRREFNLQNAWQISELTVNLLRDDGAIVYLNGQEIVRSNMPAGAVTYTTQSAGTASGADESTFFPFTADPTDVLEEGSNVLAVEVHQTSGGSSDVSFNLELIGTTSASGLIETDVEAEMLGVNASVYLRIPFTVNDPAEYSELYLQMAYEDGYVAYLNGVEVAARNAPAAPQWNSAAPLDRPVADAVQPEGVDLSDDLDLLVAGDNLLAVHALNDGASDPVFLIVPTLIAQSSISVQQQYFTSPTPGQENVPGVLGMVADTQFSVDRGFYDQPFDVEITTSTGGAEIRYTLDGSQPTATYGTVYSDRSRSPPPASSAPRHSSRATWRPTSTRRRTCFSTR